MKPKIALAIPSRDTVCCETLHSTVAMIGRFAQLFVATGQAEVSTVTVLGTLLPQMRNSLVEQAIRLNCTHIFWIDSDMKFPSDTLERLLKHDVPCVGVNYSQRKRPCKPTAARVTEKGRTWVYGDSTAETGLEEVEFVGHGLCLVEVGVYEALPKPWYMLGWSKERQCVIGEDVFFCQRMSTLGHRPYVDHDLSREVRHIGTHEYSLDDAVHDRAELIASQQAEKRDVA